MIVCHCYKKTDREICDSARRGELSSADVHAKGPGSACGGCIPAIREILERAERTRDTAPRPVRP